jgi:hypothetical protein
MKLIRAALLNIAVESSALLLYVPSVPETKALLTV